MGNLFFMLRMGVYTVFLIMILQVKVGSTTLEEKLYQLTRQSELAGQVQGVAQGIIGFAINQYRGLTGQTSEPLRLPDEVNSERLRVRLKDLKNSINRKWETVEEIKTQSLEVEEMKPQDMEAEEMKPHNLEPIESSP